MFSRGRLCLLAMVLILVTACDSLPIGKPSTSAPRASDYNESVARCAERRDAISDWEQEQKRKIENEWIDQERGLWQSVAKVERLQEEAGRHAPDASAQLQRSAGADMVRTMKTIKSGGRGAGVSGGVIADLGDRAAL